MKIDLRDRCKRCGKMPRGKQRLEQYRRYQPFCSYSCQQWWQLDEAYRYINQIRRADTDAEINPPRDR